MRANIRLATSLLVISWAGACSGLNTQNMVTDQTSFGVKHASTVALDIAGGGRELWYSSALDPEELEAALRMSLEKTALFRGIVGLDTADYVLSVNVTYAGIQSGPSPTAWVNADWTISARGSTDRIWAAQVVAKGRVGVEEIPESGTRESIAFERGTKAVIDKALRQIGELHLRVPLSNNAP
ncbi:MAG: hypothetical protein ACYTG2_02585 [Planctomycetota bacterium]|jgi:hypothetical protein